MHTSEQASMLQIATCAIVRPTRKASGRARACVQACACAHVSAWLHGCREACRRWPGYAVALAAHTRRVALAGGDALYLPPGWWHQVDSAGELPHAV